ncbi:MAG TPA: bifunctional phosphoribosyl-AMP cyclohydrolase/phosphoribosyl-ATP diphosphatase HisIE [Xanthomonadales bacterium]|nr:bifunctional phosphoribosyl-AMP cyclohydrolase/phosphoribosyl-ATP diphosphatase HisIE [Xanthomonadales bacterium]
MRIESVDQLGQLDWAKGDGLLPAVVQDAFDGRVLMQAWMNEEALAKTLQTGKVTFHSRSRGQLWTKGETSGNFLNLQSIQADCDNDSLLVLAIPDGPTCHRSTTSCFDSNETVYPQLAFLAELETLITQRDRERPAGSYTTSLLESGVRRIAQKIGEEGVETALAASNGDDEEVCNESADLLYHLLVMLRVRNIPMADIIRTLQNRHG